MGKKKQVARQSFSTFKSLVGGQLPIYSKPIKEIMCGIQDANRFFNLYVTFNLYVHLLILPLTCIQRVDKVPLNLNLNNFFASTC